MEVKSKLENLFKPELGRLDLEETVVEKIWSFGPRKSGPNILINAIPGYIRKSIWGSSSSATSVSEETTKRIAEYDSVVVGGFQVCFVLPKKKKNLYKK